MPAEGIEACDPSEGCFRRNPASWVGLLVAVVALGLAVFPTLLIEAPKTSATGIVGRLLSGRESPAEERYHRALKRFEIAAMAAGIAAAVILIVGAARRENRMLAWSGVGIAGLALIWQHIVVGIVIAIILLVILAWSS